MKKFKKIMLFAALLCLPLLLIECRPKHKSPEQRAEQMTKMITKKLDLSESQKQTLGKIKDEIVQKMKAFKPQRDQLMGDFIELVKHDNLDKVKLLELQKKRQAHMAEMESLMIDKMIEFHKVLTPAQRQNAASHLTKMRDHIIEN